MSKVRANDGQYEEDQPVESQNTSVNISTAIQSPMSEFIQTKKFVLPPSSGIKEKTKKGTMQGTLRKNELILMARNILNQPMIQDSN